MNNNILWFDIAVEDWRLVGMKVDKTACGVAKLSYMGEDTVRQNGGTKRR